MFAPSLGIPGGESRHGKEITEKTNSIFDGKREGKEINHANIRSRWSRG